MDPQKKHPSQLFLKKKSNVEVIQPLANKVQFSFYVVQFQIRVQSID